MSSPHNIVILTGSGISAESGVKTFRASDGLWEEHRVEDVATPEAYARDPRLVQNFYNMRRAQLKEVEPNPAHIAIAKLEQEYPGDVCLVTQNVDNLHERAGSKQLIHMHGELASVFCKDTQHRFEWIDDIDIDSTACECCGKTGTLRPDIVWFGEMPYHMDMIYQKLHDATMFVSIGTSSTVYPAAGFVQEVRYGGHCHTIEINLEPSVAMGLFNETHYGKAGIEVPKWVDRVLDGEYEDI